MLRMRGPFAQLSPSHRHSRSVETGQRMAAVADASNLRRHSLRLFELAMQAFDRGDAALGEELTARALQYLDESRAGTAAHAPPPPAEPSQPVAQQQQQVPPK